MNFTNYDTLNPSNFNEISKAYEELASREISSYDDLQIFIKDKDNIDIQISEEAGWRYINMTRFTANEENSKLYTEYIKNIIPKVEIFNDQLNEKILNSKYLKEFKNDYKYGIFIKSLEYQKKIFRKKNLPLLSKIQLKAHEYSQIMGQMTVIVDGKETTLQSATTKLESVDRSEREKMYRLISDRRYKEKDQLDAIFSEIIDIRDNIAKNADCASFTDYMFIKLNRFDYSIDDCLLFHDTVKEEVVPFLNTLAEMRKDALELKELKPWDLAVDIYNDGNPLKPFTSEKELINKTVNVFNKIDPFFGQCLRKMESMKHLDLFSRKGKAPGGYNYPLYKSNVPFIFMNATHTFNDMTTLLHEGGHAIHSFLTKDLFLSSFKSAPLEISEVASMGMELISMDYWDEFFPDKKRCNRAKYIHFSRIINIFPWVATIDKFQHWIYANPTHNLEERRFKWCDIFNEFSDNVTDWQGQEIYKDYLWQKQLHLFEVPFYYIEYAIAQLAAIAIWKNYSEDKNIERYKSTLKAGNTLSIPRIYDIAGINFSHLDSKNTLINEEDFHQRYNRNRYNISVRTLFEKESVKELMSFVRMKINDLN